MSATHFIEIFRDEKLKQMAGPVCEIKDLEKNLLHTKKSGGYLKTLAVIKITPKPNVVIATYKPDLSATIIEQA